MTSPDESSRRPAGSGADPWSHGYFDDAFIDLYEPLLPQEVARMQAEAIVELLGLERGSRVLDLGCGWGRHALELADLGCSVVGIDQSLPLIERARADARQRGLTIELRVGDARELPWVDEFDAVLSLFSSLGYGSPDDDLRVLRGAARALRAEGSFLLETMHRDHVAREFTPRDWWWGKSGQPVWVERELDLRAGISREWLRWLDGGKVREKYHEIRVRSATEWESLVESAGLDLLACYGGWELVALEAASEELILVASPQG